MKLFAISFLSTLALVHGNPGLRSLTSTDEADAGTKEQQHTRALAVPRILKAEDDDDGGHDWGTFQNGSFTSLPGIHKFDLNFAKTDHHITRIKVNPSRTGVSVAYHDKNGDDDFNWQVEAMQLPSSTFTRRTTGTARGCTRTGDLYNGQHSHTAILQSFDVKFISSDKHLNRFKVAVKQRSSTRNPYLEICFHDKNSDDWFTYDVTIAMVDRSKIAGYGATYNTESQYDRGGPASDYIGSKIGYKPALVGFNFDFASSDKHIDRIRVDLSRNNYVDVSYDDKRNDDAYYWDVQWAFLSN